MKSLITGFLGGLLGIGAFFLVFKYADNFRSYEQDPDRNKRWALRELRKLTLEIESYRLVFGIYPATLKDARNGFVGYDEGAAECDCAGDYYYKLDESGETYHLLSKGVDCTPLTEDDLYPKFTEAELSNIGFRKPNVTLASASDYSCKGS